MKNLGFAFAAVILLAGGADAKPCRDAHGRFIHCPPPVTAPAGATARCRDGSYSFSKHHSGTCSHHGGVAAWLQ